MIRIKATVTASIIVLIAALGGAEACSSDRSQRRSAAPDARQEADLFTPAAELDTRRYHRGPRYHGGPKSIY